MIQEATKEYSRYPFRLMYVMTENDGSITGYEVPHRTRTSAQIWGEYILQIHPDIPTMYIVEVDQHGQAVDYRYEFLRGGDNG